MTLFLVLIEELADSRDGVLTLEEAVRGGLTPRQTRHRVRSGQWIRLHPGVYLVGRREPDQRADTRAAVAWAGAGAVASGLTAAWWWGLRDWAPVIAEVTVPHTRSRRPRAGVGLHRRNLDPVDLVVLRGLPVTALPLTVLDAAVALGHDSGRPLVDRALQRRVSFGELHAAYCRALGRHGSPWLGRVLREAADGACSQAERGPAPAAPAGQDRGLGGQPPGGAVRDQVLDRRRLCGPPAGRRGRWLGVAFRRRPVRP
ncbi:MAG: type IV toxin-antitoxin system AbiEi family antitoxin domain-containing protein [Pseudonocardiaceae bacterium]